MPFPANVSDYTNAMLSRVVLEKKTQKVLRGEYVIPSSANYHRFCSNFVAHGKERLLPRQILLTSEEATDSRQPHRRGVAAARAGAEQAGVVVAYDMQEQPLQDGLLDGPPQPRERGRDPGLPLLGRSSPGTTPSTLRRRSSTCTSTKGADGLMNDAGALYGFKSDDPAVNDYGDLSARTTEHVRQVRARAGAGRAGRPERARERGRTHNGIFQFIRDRGHRLRPHDAERRLLRRHR